MYIKSENTIQISFSEQLFPWKMGAKGPISLMLLINGDRLTVHLTSYGGHIFFRQKYHRQKRRSGDVAYNDEDYNDFDTKVIS